MKAMRYATLCSAALLLLVMLPYTALAGAGFEARGNVEVAANLTERWKGILQAETGIDEHGDQSRYHSDVGVVHTGRAKWIDVGVRYRTIFKRIHESDWTRENRYYLDLVTRHRVYDIAFSHRVRLEYNEWEDEFDDYGTLRYRIAVNPPYALHAERERRILKDYKRRLCASYELSADSEKDDIVQQQYKLGWSVAISETVMGDVYYLWEWNNSSVDTKDLNVAGLALKVLL